MEGISHYINANPVYNMVQVPISVRVSSFLNLLDSVSSHESPSWQNSHFLRFCGFHIPQEADWTLNWRQNSSQPWQFDSPAFDFPRHVGVLWWWELDGRGETRHRVIFGSQVVIIQRWNRKRHGSHLAADWVELGEQSKMRGVETGEQDNVRQLIKHVQWEEKKTDGYN